MTATTLRCPFVLGRSILPGMGVWLGMLVVLWLGWSIKIGTGLRVITGMEVVGVAMILTVGIMATPRMPSWEAFAGRQVKLRVVTLIMAGSLVTAALPMAIFQAIDHVPDKFMPGVGGLTTDGYQPSIWYFLCTNIIIVGSVGLIAIPYVGRLVGCGLAAAALVILFILSANTDVPVGFNAEGPGMQNPGWVPALVLLLIAGVTWWRTVGTSNLGRMLDRRH